MKRKGYRIVDRNFYTRFGELDIIAMDGEELVFVEVKGRRGIYAPEEAVDRRKLNCMTKAALIYMKKKKVEGKPYRFDVIAIDGKKLRHIKGVLP